MKIKHKILLVLLVGLMLTGTYGCVIMQSEGNSWEWERNSGITQRTPYLCENKSEIYYEELLKTVSYENVRMAVGRYRNCSHQWVEVWENGKWEIEDPSLGNFTNSKDYVTFHHFEWESVMKHEMPDKLRERSR